MWSLCYLLGGLLGTYAGALIGQQLYVNKTGQEGDGLVNIPQYVLPGAILGCFSGILLSLLCAWLLEKWRHTRERRGIAQDLNHDGEQWPPSPTIRP